MIEGLAIAYVPSLNLQPWAIEGNVRDRGHPGEGFCRAVGEVVKDE